MLLRIAEWNMLLGKVTGVVWGTIKSERLKGYKLLEVQPLKLCRDSHIDKRQGYTIGPQAPDEPLQLSKTKIVAVDALGAGVGEYVIVGNGTRVRDITLGEDVPIKTLIVGIVDSAWVQGEAVE